MPEDIHVLLALEGLQEAYDARPPYQRNYYLGWIDRAVRLVTRARRVEQMPDELRSGSGYMGMPWPASRTRPESSEGTPPGPDAL